MENTHDLNPALSKPQLSRLGWLIIFAAPLALGGRISCSETITHVHGDAYTIVVDPISVSLDLGLEVPD